MKKHRLPLLGILTAVFAAFTLGLFLGRNQNQSTISVSVPASMQTAPIQMPTQPTEPIETVPTIQFPININTASREAFQLLPGIGDTLAQRILRYREEHGDFPSVEALMNVEGIGEKTLEDILDLITIGG